jgi:hypothetical protein
MSSRSNSRNWERGSDTEPPLEPASRASVSVPAMVLHEVYRFAFGLFPECDSESARATQRDQRFVLVASHGAGRGLFTHITRSLCTLSPGDQVTEDTPGVALTEVFNKKRET